MGMTARLGLLAALTISSAPLSAEDIADVSPERIEEARIIYAENMRAAVGERMTNWLVEQGLSIDTATQIVKKATDEYSVCVVDVLVQEASRQDLPILPILDSMADFSISPEIKSIGEKWDKEATREAIMPCLAGIQSEAGIPMSE